jgi:glycosyltransferase involved in cell wall biosynthesis
MTIAFVHPHRALLPELDAYTAFFQDKGFQTIVTDQNGMGKINAPVAWHFLGVHHKRNPSAINIHEYGSASIPPFSRWKDLFKKIANIVPDYRIFFSEYVFDQFSFTDGVPFGFRDHGIIKPKEPGSLNKIYDFIYVGSVDKNRMLSGFFDCFMNGRLRNRNLMVLSKDYDDLYASLGKPANIIFKGPVTQMEAYHFIRASRFAVNFIPDLEPFNRQTSAKFIDYSACETPIVSTDYPWVRDFQKKEGGQYFYLKKDLSNFNWEELNEFRYSFPDLKGWTWEQQIRKSGVLDFLNRRFPDLNL